MITDMSYVPDDIFAIVGKYLEDDCVSLTKLIKTRKTFKTIISSEVNLEEIKQKYIDAINCSKILMYVKKLSDNSFKLEVIKDGIDIELIVNDRNKGCNIDKKIKLYEDKIKRDNTRINNIIGFVKNERCLKNIEEHINYNYHTAHYNSSSYIYNRILLMVSQKLYNIILSIDSNYLFNSDNACIMNWIHEAIDYNSEEDDNIFQDFNY